MAICKEKLVDVIGGSTSYILKKANLNKNHKYCVKDHFIQYLCIQNTN